MKTRILSILAMLLMVGTTARAAVGDVLASGTCGTDVTWTLTETIGKFHIQKGNSGVGLVYPRVTLTISGSGAVTSKPYSTVTGLFGSAAQSIDFITDVIVEEGVTSLPSQAFYNYPVLRRVSLPTTLTTIGNGAFRDCDALKSIVIPDGVTQIPQQAFMNCDSLRSVSLGKGVTTIGSQAFKDCVRLMTVRMTRYEPTDETNPITLFSSYPFSGCVSLVSIVLPETGKERYIHYEINGKTYYTAWEYYNFTDADGRTTVFFRDLLRSDRETLFQAGTTNEWTEWVDKFSHAAPRGAEVYAVDGVENRVVKLNRLTATVTLPEAEREGPDDDGVRALVPAFVPVLIKRPGGTLTEDLKMQFVMGGELSPENGWYGSRSVNASLWGESGNYYTNEAVSRNYVPNVVPDIMASAPYGYHNNIGYIIEVIGSSPSGRNDYIIASTVDGTTLYGNADKTSAWNSSSRLQSNCSFTLDGDQFRRFTAEEMEAGLAPQHTALFVLYGDLDGDPTSPLSLSVNERTEVTIADGADNTDAIAVAASTTSNRVTLSGRTLYTDGDWNTLCLPFGVNFGTNFATNKDFFFSFMINNSQDAIIMELDTEGDYDGHQTGFDDSDGTLYLYFRRVYAIEAGKPYIVKWNNRTDNSISDPVFYDTAISADAPTPVTSQDGTVSFVGNYSPIDIAGKDRGILFLGAANTLYYPSAAMTIGSCRAHFAFNGITAGDSLTPDPSPVGEGSVKAFVLNFGDEETTPLLSPEGDDYEASPRGGLVGVSWYSLDGRKLSGKPTQKGIYIVNGKKIAIK